MIAGIGIDIIANATIAVLAIIAIWIVRCDDER